jgi:hypothetical protein
MMTARRLVTSVGDHWIMTGARFTALRAAYEHSWYVVERETAGGSVEFL